jgi:hypothetical protein
MPTGRASHVGAFSRTGSAPPPARFLQACWNTTAARDRALAFRYLRLQYRVSSGRAPAACNVCHAHLVRCLFRKTRRRHRCAPSAGMRCDLPASSRQCGPCLGWSSTYADAADTSEPPIASPSRRHRSGFDRRAEYDIPCFVPALANANDQAWTTSKDGACPTWKPMWRRLPTWNGLPVVDCVSVPGNG